MRIALNMKFGTTVALILAIAAFSTNARAYAECSESVMEVINHSNGNVYFSTDQTCGAGWCQLSGSTDFIKRGYAMLLAAQMSGKKVTFRWLALVSCTPNVLYASPDFMYTTN